MSEKKYFLENYTMLFDFYELTMANGYYKTGMADKIAYFDIFFREVPDNGGFAIAAGLEQLSIILTICTFLMRISNIFAAKTALMKNFLNLCAASDLPEICGQFRRELQFSPVSLWITVRAPSYQAQFIETFLLLTFNHQSLIATKASRIVRAAKGLSVSEFGSRRAQGPAGAILGARAAYIGGCASTACAIADERFGVPAGGTMAHSWVQMFDSEYEAFDTYCKLYPTAATLLVDTYNVLKSGVPNAIRAFKNNGITKCAVRIDSGDITYLTQKTRKMLDDAGMTECKIVISNSLDEYIIRDIIEQGACIDSFGVGERLVTSKSSPVFGGVYKLSAVEDEAGNTFRK